MEAIYKTRDFHYPGSGVDHVARNRGSTDAGRSGRGPLDGEQQRQMLEMMHQMGGIMQEMGMPKEGRMAGQHNKQFQEMRKRLNEMKKHVKYKSGLNL
jgi:archaellum component FlaC